MHTKISPVWYNAKLSLDLSHNEVFALLWAYIHSNAAGWVFRSSRNFTSATGLPISELDSAIKTDNPLNITTERGYWLQSYINEQIARGDAASRNTLCSTVAKDYASLPENVKLALLEHYPALRPVIEEYMKTGKVFENRPNKKKQEEPPPEPEAHRFLPPRFSPPDQEPDGFTDAPDSDELINF